jgi:hypothetical protein
MLPRPNRRWLAQDVIEESSSDIRRGLALIDSIDRPIITIMGSARVKPGSLFFDGCEALCRQLGEAGFAILTGGGGGIMEAANRGAHAAGAPSMAIRSGILTKERPASEEIYTHLMVAEQLMFTRRFLLLTAASGIVLFPGGFGTDNELTEALMLTQTQITSPVPILCMESTTEPFWTTNRERMAATMVPTYINAGDLGLMQITSIDAPGALTGIVQKLLAAGRCEG